jgi:hypothetical protein
MLLPVVAFLNFGDRDSSSAVVVCREWLTQTPSPHHSDAPIPLCASTPAYAWHLARPPVTVLLRGLCLFKASKPSAAQSVTACVAGLSQPTARWVVAFPWLFSSSFLMMHAVHRCNEGLYRYGAAGTHEVVEPDLRIFLDGPPFLTLAPVPLYLQPTQSKLLLDHLSSHINKQNSVACAEVKSQATRKKTGRVGQPPSSLPRRPLLDPASDLDCDPTFAAPILVPPPPA